MRRIITFLSFVLIAGSFVAANQWPVAKHQSVAPQLDVHTPSTPVPSASTDAGYKRVPVAPVYTLRPSLRPTPTATPESTATPTLTPTPSPTASPLRCGGCTPRPSLNGMKCPLYMCAAE
jgi:hypothetical protein